MLILTLDAIIPCTHQTGGYVELVAGQYLVRIDGRPVLIRGDAADRPVKGCKGGGPPLRPCALTLSERDGFSQHLRIDGVSVMLDTLTGLTDGDPVGVVEYKVASPGQSLVHAW